MKDEERKVGEEKGRGGQRRGEKGREGVHPLP